MISAVEEDGTIPAKIRLEKEGIHVSAVERRMLDWGGEGKSCPSFWTIGTIHR